MLVTAECEAPMDHLLTCVTATDLLHKLGTGTEKHSAEVLGLPVGEKGAVWSALGASNTGCTDGIQDDVALPCGLLALQLVATKGGDDLLGILVAFVGKKPPGRLGQPEHGHDNETEDDLEGDGETPREVSLGERRTVVDPVGDQCSESNDTTLDADEQTSVGGLTTLCLVGRDGRSVDAITDTGNNSSDNELCQWRGPGLRGDLDNNSQDHDESSENYTFPPTQEITASQHEHGAHQTANFVDGSDHALHSGVVSRSFEYVIEGLCADDSGHDTVWNVRPEKTQPTDTELLTLDHIRKARSQSSRL